MAEAVVLQTSAFIDLLLGDAQGRAVADALRGRQVHVTDHEEVLVAIALRARRERGLLSAPAFRRRIGRVAEAPFTVHSARELLVDAAAREHLRLDDALCVELSHRLEAPMLTTDAALAAAWPRALLVRAEAPKPLPAPHPR
ncbi:MAG: hypothetical protein ACRENY_05545 [Candidatus Dormibacteria bacterium]